jgi:hypothetical protein
MARPAGRSAAKTGLPLADLIRDEMARQSLTLTDMANAMHQAGDSCATPSSVCHWRQGKFTPYPHTVQLIAKTLRLPLDDVAMAADAQREMLAGTSRAKAIGHNGSAAIDEQLATLVS